MDIHTKRALGLGLIVIATTAGSILLAVFLDAIGLEKYKHQLGNIGSLILLLSFIYSLRKRKILFKTGNLLSWLKVHEILAVAGTFFILIHTGLHTHAAVPIISLLLIFTAFLSGLTGRYVYESGREHLKAIREELSAKGLTASEIEEQLEPLLKANKKLIAWRSFHMPLVSALAIFVIFHILSAIYYGGF